MRAKLSASAFGGWLCGCGLVASARWTWPGELAVHFQPYLGLAGLVLAAGLLALKWRPAALAAALVSVMLLAPMARYLPFRGTPRHDGASLRVATANLHRDRPGNLDLEAWLRRHDPDVIAFQEVSLPAARRLQQLLARRGSIELLPRDPQSWSRGTYGQVFFSRFPIESVDRVRGDWFGPALLVARLLVEGRELRVIAAHPMRPGGRLMNEDRNAALEAVGLHARSSGGTIVLGDLNTTAFSPAFSDLLELGRLRDSRVGIGWQPTFAPMDRLPIGIPLIAIDHVLIGDELVVLERQRTENIGSDHWPVVAEVGFARSD